MNVNITPIKMLMAQTGTYTEQYYRPFETNITTGSINSIKELTESGASISPQAVAAVAGSVIAPSANTEGAVGIANGWQSRRFRFSLIIEESTRFQKTGIKRILFGYTDHCEVANNFGSPILSPDMRVYFNSEIILVETPVQTPHGIIIEPRFLATNQILRGYSEGELHRIQNGGTGYLQTVRPEDVFSHAQTRTVYEKLQQNNVIPVESQGNYGPNGFSSQPIMDLRTAFSTGSPEKYNRRSELSPSVYLSSLLTGFYKTTLDEESDDLETQMSNARGFTRNDPIGNNDFLALLRESAGYETRGFVTWSDLNRIFPQLDGVTEVSLDTGHSLRRMSTADDGNNWNGMANTDVAAALIAQTVPGIVESNAVRNIEITAHSGDTFGSYIVTVHPDKVRMLLNTVDAAPFVQRIMNRLEVEVLAPLSKNNQHSFSLTVYVDVVGEIMIDVSIDGCQAERYIGPSFADSLSSTVLTMDGDRAGRISSDLVYLARESISGYQPTGLQQPETPAIITSSRDYGF